jgi:hypothetical protein
MAVELPEIDVNSDDSSAAPVVDKAPDVIAANEGPTDAWQPTGAPVPLTGKEWVPTGEARPLPQPSKEGGVWEETKRAIAKADRDYIVPMIGLPADIVGWALDSEKGLPGGTEWWNNLPGIGDVPEPTTRAGKLGAEVLGQGATGLVQGGAIGKTVQAGGQALGAFGRQATGAAMSKLGGQIADPAANAASALGGAAAGQGLEAIAPEGFEPLAHGVGSVLGGALAGGVTAPPRSISSVDKAFDTYQRLGLHPSAAMVGVGGRTAQLLEGNVLPSALGSAGKMHNFASQTVDKFQSVKDNIASRFGAARTKYDMGKDARETVAQGFQARKQEGANLLDAIGQAFGPNDKFIPKNLNRALFKPAGSASTTAVQEYANDPEIAAIKAVLDKTQGSLTYQDMLAIKTKLGNMMEQSYANTVNKAQISQLVSAIDNDMKATIESIGNPDTVRDWEQGKAIYNNAMRDYEKAFKDLLGTKDMPVEPEAVYRILMGRGSTKASADIEAFETVWRQLGKAKQGELAATVLAHMGNTDPAKMGSVEGFSLNTFLTQYKNLSPQAKQMLFRSTGNAQLEQALDDLMFAADKIGGWDKVASTSRSNISGTMLGQVGAIAGIAATADWLTALKFAALDIGGPAAAAWTLTNPKGIRAIADALNKANDAAIGAARGVMAINPPKMPAPGQNIPNSAPQQNPAGGNQIPGRQSSLQREPSNFLSDASPDPIRPGAQYASMLPEDRHNPRPGRVMGEGGGGGAIVPTRGTSKPVSGTMAGVKYEVTPEQHAEMTAARQTGAGREEIQKMVDGFKGTKAPPTADDIITAAKRVPQRTKSLGKAHVNLTDLRKEFPQLSKEEFDQAVIKAQRDGKLQLYREDNQQKLTDAERNAAIYIGNEPRHMVVVE